MNSIFLALLGVFVFFDLSVLRKQNRSLFEQTFKVPGWVLPVCLVICCVLLFQSSVREDGLTILLLTAGLVYVTQRYRFRSQIVSDSTDDQLVDEKLFLASDAFGILLLWFGGMMAFSVLMRAILAVAPQFKSDLGELVVVSAFSSVFIIILIYKTIQKYPDIDFLKATGLRREGQKITRIVILPAMIGLGFAALSSFLIFARPAQPATPLGEMINATQSSFIFIAFIGVAVLFAPLFEEIVFRGYFFYVLKKVKGQGIAIVVIAAVFGLLHFDQYWGDWMAITMVSLLGVILTLLRAWTKTSIASIVAHYVYNGSMTIIPMLVLILSNPAFFEYQMNYANLNAQQKEELLIESIEKHPEYTPAYNDLAWLYAEEGKNLDEALRLVEKALVTNEFDYAFLDTKAEVLYKMGRANEAVKIAEQLLDLYPDDVYVKTQLEKFRVSQTKNVLGIPEK